MSAVWISVAAASGTAEKVGEAVAMVNMRAWGKRKAVGALRTCLVIGLSMVLLYIAWSFSFVFVWWRCENMVTESGPRAFILGPSLVARVLCSISRAHGPSPTIHKVYVHVLEFRESRERGRDTERHATSPTTCLVMICFRPLL